MRRGIPSASFSGRKPHGLSRVAVALLVSMLSPVPAATQSPSQLKENRSTCLSGKYPTLCNYSWLTQEERAAAQRAERAENLKTCLSGRYPTLCKHGLLSAQQLAQVREAERQENLKTCLSGKYPTLCRKKLLSPEELRRVRIAEDQENLRTCLTGRYPTLCDKSRLSTEQKQAVSQAEASAVQAQARRPASKNKRTRRSPCESGHWIDSVSSDGAIIVLEDGSVWEVDPVDTIDSSLWLPVSEITACADRLINTDDNEVVSATPLGAASTTSETAGRKAYQVEAAANDETFIINGEVFEAKTYCFGLDKGDEVIFIKGSPFGACASATLLITRTSETCEVWCE